MEGQCSRQGTVCGEASRQEGNWGQEISYRDRDEGMGRVARTSSSQQSRVFTQQTMGPLVSGVFKQRREKVKFTRSLWRLSQEGAGGG